MSTRYVNPDRVVEARNKLECCRRRDEMKVFLPIGKNRPKPLTESEHHNDSVFTYVDDQAVVHEPEPEEEVVEEKPSE
tara:strand:+ start:1122 stop:1355 length:234 start_codon:yes stop_codon:yes gene_type:complete